MAKNVKIIYNDDGSDEYVFGGEKMRLDSISKTAKHIEATLKALGYTTGLIALKDTCHGLDNFIRKIKGAEDSMIFNLCEGYGTSYYEMHVAALLELYDLKFTGSPPLTLALALNKAFAKDVLRGANVPTPGYCVLREPPEELSRGLDFPLIVKPLMEDASVGIEADSVVGTMEELRKRVGYIVEEYSQPVIVEEYIDGREFNVSLLGNGEKKMILPPAELKFVDFPENAPRICCYESKWIKKSPFYNKTVPVCPAEIDSAMKDKLSEVALRAHNAIGCLDYARVDMRLDSRGRIGVLEVNPNPDISEEAGFARAARAAGIVYPELIEKIVSIAEARYSEDEIKGGWEDETPPARCGEA
ncbi:MAG TPA: ATP-grasp domain-containing protein [Thermodesulfobacteriota bacterium]|nr:ATP-grasp domain-containing protein [Thermodesulfobacteriota bacterium]